MTASLPYDKDFDPPAPVVGIRVTNATDGSSVLIRALVDTGADSTVIPGHVAEELGLPIVEYARIEGVGSVREVSVHAALVQLGDVETKLSVAAFEEERVVGRDLLRHFVTRLDGPKGILSFETAKPSRAPRRATRTRR